MLDGQPLKIWETRRTDASFDAPAGSLRVADGRLLLKCGDGVLEILSLQASGKKRMDAATFVRGCPLDGKCLC